MNEKVYDQDTLQHLKQVELDILKDFIKICQKYNLTYFATGGTAIGALRHQGFIPWDDDIDVCMLRKDYDTFMRVAPERDGRYIHFYGCPHGTTLSTDVRENGKKRHSFY